MLVAGALLLAGLVTDCPCGAEALLPEEPEEAADEILQEEGEPEALRLWSRLLKVEEHFPEKAFNVRTGQADGPDSHAKAVAQAAADRKKYLAQRRLAFAVQREELAKSLAALTDKERTKVLRALPSVLVQRPYGEASIQASMLLQRFKSPALVRPLRTSLDQSLSRLEEETKPLPEEYRTCLVDLCARFAWMLGELGNKESLPAMLRAWKIESATLESCHALQGIVFLAGTGHVDLFREAFDKGKTPETRYHALRGLCRLGLGLSQACEWLAKAMAANQTGEMDFVRRALKEFPSADAERGVRLFPSLAGDEPGGFRHLATTEIGLFLALRLVETDPERGSRLLRLVAELDPGRLYRETALQFLERPPPGECQQVAPGAFRLDGPFLAADGQPLALDQVASGYGQSYRVLAAGQDIRDVWADVYGEPPKVVGRDLSQDDWQTTPLARDEVVLDPRTGRIRFPVGEARPVRLLGKTTPGRELFFAWPDQVVLQGGFATMSNGENWDAGLAVIDLKDPARPQLAGTAYLGGFARGIEVYDGHAYVGNDAGGFFAIVGVRAMEQRKPLEFWERAKDVSGQAVAADPARKLLVAPHGSLLKFLSLEDPRKPKELGSVELGAAPNALHVENDLACAACSAAAILVDCADPKSPRILSRVAFKNAFDVKLRRGRAYISDSAEGAIVILDVRQPAKPEVVSRIEGLNRNGLRFDLASRGETTLLFVAEYGAGDVRVLDVTDVAAPRETGRWVNSSPWKGLPGRGGNLADIAVDGNLAVVTNLCFGLHVLDVSDPAQPKLLGEVRAAGEAGNVRVVDDETVAVEDFCQALLVFDTKDPADMAVIGQYHTGGRVWPGLAWRRPHALISHQFPGGITMVDLSDKRAPRPTSALLYESIGASCIVARHNVGYVAHRYGYNVTVLDLSDPSALKKLFVTPSIVSSFPDLALNGGLLLVANFCADSGPGPLSILDVTNPGQVRKISQLDLNPGCSAVSAQGRLAYCTGGGRLRVVDIRNPFDPRVVADVPSALGAIKVRGDYAYAISGKGIAVYRLPLWPADSQKWASFPGPELVGETGDLHSAWLCGFDVRGPRAYAVAYNQLFCVEVPWSQVPPGPLQVARLGSGRPEAR